MRSRLILLLGLLALWTELTWAFVPKKHSPPKEKPGWCPAPKGADTCREACTSDWDCSRATKCCSNGCGHVCLDPVFKVPEKPGWCPVPKGPGICMEACTSDWKCPGATKCCSNGCGLACRNPIFKGK